MDLFTEFHKKLTDWYIRSKKSDGIFFYKPYIHFDISPLPKSIKNVESSTEFKKLVTKIYDKISNPDFYTGTKKYNFLPLLRVEESKYKFKNKISSSGKQRIREKSLKVRPLTYCSNFEKLIYTYFNIILEDLYEQKVRELGIGENVLAYRKIPKLENTGLKLTNKCNIEFANEAFNEISIILEQVGSCTAIALDISGFFDNISHSIIKKEWINLFPDQIKLPIDHYKIFQSITKFSFIRKNLFLKKILNINNRKELKQAIFGYTKKSQKAKLENVDRYGSLKIYNPDLQANLKIPDIINRCKKYIKTPNYKGINPVKKIFESHNQDFGIPQGLPLSGVISNISFINLDLTIKNICSRYNSSYVRYSDDILIITPGEYNSHIETEIISVIEHDKRQNDDNDPFLKINNGKTEVVEFVNVNDSITVSEKKSGKIGKPLTYLGFTFDGVNVSLKTNGISKKLTKLKYFKIRRNRESIKTNQTIPKTKINFQLKNSGFIKYVDRASVGNPRIKKQIRFLIKKSSM